jgi:2-polyprenyl-6-methoxyphenol hydroxylase-like FAD-dependent oxidoreductase
MRNLKDHVLVSSQPILIAGGGIGGLTAAIALRRAGFLVHERAPEIREVGAGLTIQANDRGPLSLRLTERPGTCLQLGAHRYGPPVIVSGASGDRGG